MQYCSTFETILVCFTDNIVSNDREMDICWTYSVLSLLDSPRRFRTLTLFAPGRLLVLGLRRRGVLLLGLRLQAALHVIVIGIISAVRVLGVAEVEEAGHQVRVGLDHGLLPEQRRGRAGGGGGPQRAPAGLQLQAGHR